MFVEHTKERENVVMTRGYIYINSSKSYPKGILKIGRSYDAESRRREHSTALPYPQVIEKKYSVKNMISAEKVIHQALKNYHYYNGAGTEFFKITLKEAIKVGDRLFTPIEKIERAIEYRVIYTPKGLKKG